jgi:hypothetical protein
VARDLDRIRTALGLQKISFLGVSWGTWLGAVYRSTFPASIGRMFLDSTASPVYSIGSVAFDDARAAATEQNFARMADWLAQRDGTYGFGSTGEQVRAAILALRQAYDANPKRFTDMSAVADGAMVAGLASATSVSVNGRPGWEQAGQALAALRDATGDTAPPIIKTIFDNPPMPVVPDAPELVNQTMNQGIICNGAASRLDFTAAWAVYQRRLAANPATGRSNPFSANCAGWPLPVQEVRLHHGGGSLVLSGHRYEILSPYQWSAQMRAAVGGTVYTVDDDMHASVLHDSTCSADVVSYFTTGRIGPGCPGLALP